MEQSSRLRRGALCVAVAVIGLGFLAISATISYRYGQILATNPADQITFGAVGIAAAGLKAFLPFVIAVSWARQQRATLAVATVTLALCCAYSMAASYSLAAAGRSPAVATALEQAELAQRITDLGSPRPASVVAPLIAAERNVREKAKLRSEYAAAQEVDRLRKERQPSPESEAGVGELGQLLGVERGRVRAVLLALIAICLELGEVTSLWFAATLARSPRTVAAPLPPAAEPVPEPQPEPAPLTLSPVAVAAAPRPQKVALAGWLAQYVEARSGATLLPDSALAEYAALCRAKKRRQPDRARFMLAFDAVATAAGLTRAKSGRAYQRAVAA